MQSVNKKTIQKLKSQIMQSFVREQQEPVLAQEPQEDSPDQQESPILNPEDVDAIESEIESNPEPTSDEQGIDLSSEETPTDEVEEGKTPSAAESVIEMTVQMALYKGLKDVADEFSRSFDVDKFAVLSIFQKYLLNDSNLQSASTSVVNLIKKKKKEQQNSQREQMPKKSTDI